MDAGLMDMFVKDPEKVVMQYAYGPGPTHDFSLVDTAHRDIDSNHYVPMADGANLVGDLDAIPPTSLKVAQVAALAKGTAAGAHAAVATPAQWTNNDSDTTAAHGWMPQHGYKYWPTSVKMKFQQTRVRVFYNPTNLVQYVYVTELRRKRSQGYVSRDNVQWTMKPNDQWLSADPEVYNINGGGGAAYGYSNPLYDIEVMDMQPEGQAAKNGNYTVNGSAGLFFAMCHYAYSQQTDKAHMGQLNPGGGVPGRTQLQAVYEMAVAGEVLSRFIYPRFGQPDFLARQYGAYAGDAIVGGADQFYVYQGMDYGNSIPIKPDLQAPTGGFLNVTEMPSSEPGTFGYAKEQNVFPSTTTAYKSYGIWDGSDVSNADFTVSPWFNPTRNRYLKRLFFMKRRVYMIPPGGTAQHICRIQGNTTPVRGHLIANMTFYSRSALANQSAAPYGMPIDEAFFPAELAYASKRQAGYQTVDLWTHTRGQMAYNNQSGSTANPLQYSGTQILYHDKLINRWQVCSYGKPLLGGTHGHVTLLNPDSTFAHYASTYPTAAPVTAVTQANPVT
jgi:hypothetical protein